MNRFWWDLRGRLYRARHWVSVRVFKRFRFLGICDCGRWFVYPERRRLNTLYVNDEQNWMTSCEECYQQALDYYSELWRDYYGSVL